MAVDAENKLYFSALSFFAALIPFSVVLVRLILLGTWLLARLRELLRIIERF
jgi:cytochrome oxidase assembly protein ShyY1